MNVKCGIDMVYIPDIARMRKNDVTMNKFFHTSEIENGSDEHLAGIIAAKEAFFKCLGMVPKFLEVEIGHEATGKPCIKNSLYKDTYTSIDISISHEKDYAVGLVVMLDS